MKITNSKLWLKIERAPTLYGWIVLRPQMVSISSKNEFQIKIGNKSIKTFRHHKKYKFKDQMFLKGHIGSIWPLSLKH